MSFDHDMNAGVQNQNADQDQAAELEQLARRTGRSTDDLVAEAVTRSWQGRSVICEVTVRRGDDVIAEFSGRGAQIAPADEKPSVASKQGRAGSPGRVGPKEDRTPETGADTGSVDGPAAPEHAPGG